MRGKPYTTCRMVPEQHWPHGDAATLLLRAGREMRADSVHDLPHGARAALPDDYTAALLLRAGREMRADPVHDPAHGCQQHTRLITQAALLTWCREKCVQIPYTTCHMVPEQHLQDGAAEEVHHGAGTEVRADSYTTCRIVTEEDGCQTSRRSLQDDLRTEVRADSLYDVPDGGRAMRAAGAGDDLYDGAVLRVDRVCRQVPCVVPDHCAASGRETK